MNNEGDFIASLIIAVIIGLVFVALSYFECDSKAQSFVHSWGPIQGCMIKEPKDGIWIPLENYRNVD